MIRKMQVHLKESGRSFALTGIKLISGFFLGLTFALIFRQVMNVGNFAFAFVIVSGILTFYKISQGWKFTGVLLFNLFCAMTALLLRMYIFIAPGQ